MSCHVNKLGNHQHTAERVFLSQCMHLSFCLGEASFALCTLLTSDWWAEADWVTVMKLCPPHLLPLAPSQSILQ